MTYQISKNFSFCYGHRVWSQALTKEYCETTVDKPKCRHIHGHEGLVSVHLSSPILENGMVTDFLHLGWLKNFIDEHIDHKFIIDKNDPMFTFLVNDLYVSSNLNEKTNTLTMKDVNVPGHGWLAGQEIYLGNITRDTPVYETLEGYFIVNFIPTSENLARWLFDIVSVKMEPLGIDVDFVEWYETPKSCARYYG